ncbi:Endoglucanase [Cystobacter fuscus DSM 2262]|uniref:Glucanase n=1 Tax=Cystobacter fuscus (strain ATCC 25194 / DSM 2262 / NBRC 100088 / M29) TaxID=1242864 RepID=S9PM77_CYSF2|nr:glycoside hydrolase family 6 protein [Cystobacter fuscus]EPX65375.1 Endoglucanase [Cystobacter fuscus DSM 2262]
MNSRRTPFRPFLAAALTLASALVSACIQEPDSLTGEESPTESASQTEALTELIVNGNFNAGSTTPWWNGANTQSRVENAQWRIDVTTGTANPWDAIVGQNGIRLTSGQSYTLSFTASASAAGALVTTVQTEVAPYTATLNQRVTVDATPRRYSFPFTSSLSTAQGQVTFQLGGAAARTLRLDDISLTTGSGGGTDGGTGGGSDGGTDGGTGGGSGPLAMTNGFYVDPNSNPAAWARANSGDSRAASIQSAIASKPMARWFGNWNSDITAEASSYVGAAAAAGKLPVLVAYNIPGRDCGSHSGGGAGSPEAYRTWISGLASGIGNRPAIVLIEPDAVAQLDCLPDDTARQTRLGLLRYATEQLRDRAPNTWAYLDGGNARWIAADTMAQRLQSAGVSNIRGFVINISNFYTTAESISYGNAVSAALSSRYGYGKPFVVDTSRNGNGSNGEWCNPAGRKLGTPSQVGGGAELLVWAKIPGDSDGSCGTAPSTPAGQFSPDLAIRLINGT